ncbi:hypothetical protein BC833DRAFT_597027 [Globomyces pollinis-pini]|nr:hypothetical protein BC833DRAFT_597027 [Globomyces pollinis-pini]
MLPYVIDPGYDHEIQELEELTDPNPIYQPAKWIFKDGTNQKLPSHLIITSNLSSKIIQLQFTNSIHVASFESKQSSSGIHLYKSDGFYFITFDKLILNFELLYDFSQSLLDKNVQHVFIIDFIQSSPNSSNTFQSIGTNVTKKFAKKFQLCSDLSASILTMLQVHQKFGLVYQIFQNEQSLNTWLEVWNEISSLLAIKLLEIDQKKLSKVILRPTVMNSMFL